MGTTGGRGSMMQRPLIVRERNLPVLWKGGVMRFVHIADVHLGACPDAGPLYTDGRAREIWEAFENVIQVCREERTDLLLIAGDLFHRQPLVRELKEVDYLFSTLDHTKVVLIAGNHDHITSTSHYRDFQWSGNVAPLFGKRLGYADFRDLDTAVYGFSYHAKEIEVPLYDRMKAPGRRGVEILLGHGGDSSHIPINRKALADSGFDYVALGHIHRPQTLVKDRIAYAGALEPIDKNDTGAHGYIKGEITEAGTVTKWIPSAKRQYIHMEVPVSEESTAGSIKDELADQMEQCGRNHIYKVILTGSRSRDMMLDTKRLAGTGNVMEIVDETVPAYDMRTLYEQNRDNIVGSYIRRFSGCEKGSLEYEALCQGVEALLESRG